MGINVSIEAKIQTINPLYYPKHCKIAEPSESVDGIVFYRMTQTTDLTIPDFETFSVAVMKNAPFAINVPVNE